jgi:AhpD family alkylhydroperoxidase
MDERINELVAIGAAAAVNCQPCMELHLAACDRLGIRRDEVAAAIEVGLMVNKGAAAKTRNKVTSLLGNKASEGGEVGCCCP